MTFLWPLRCQLSVRTLGAARRQESAGESAWKGQKHINVSFGMRVPDYNE